MGTLLHFCRQGHRDSIERFAEGCWDKNHKSWDPNKSVMAASPVCNHYAVLKVRETFVCQWCQQVVLSAGPSPAPVCIVRAPELGLNSVLLHAFTLQNRISLKRYCMVRRIAKKSVKNQVFKNYTKEVTTSTWIPKLLTSSFVLCLTLDNEM